MRSDKKKASISRTDALESVPIKNPQVKETVIDAQGILLSYPIHVKPWAAALLRKIGKPPEQIGTKKLQLHALGTSVWQMIDGRRTVRQIIQGFSKEQQVHRKEAEVSVTQFFRELGKRGLIGMK